MSSFGYVLVIAGTLAAFVPMIIGTLVHHRAVTAPSTAPDRGVAAATTATIPDQRERVAARAGV